MARSLARYACQQCGAIHAKWTGRCDGCGAWNSLIEELPRESPPSGLAKGGVAKDRRERECYVRIVELYVEIAEELEALIDGWASP